MYLYNFTYYLQENTFGALVLFSQGDTPKKNRTGFYAVNPWSDLDEWQQVADFFQ